MTAILERRDGRVRATVPARLIPTPDGVRTPLFTRHMLGAIEAERDRRRMFRETHPDPRRRAHRMTHPRIAAAIAARARRVSEARVDEGRWADEGGRFDPAGTARRRNGHKEMKRCSS
jgi:hypothetical protein